jgi:type I restriction enzyme, S subunit
MKQGWESRKLGDICDIKTGKSNAKDADADGKYTFFDRSKKAKKSNRFLFDCEALIIPGEGAQFFPRYYSGKFDLHQRVYSISNFPEEVDIHFVQYYLIFNHKHFERVAVGTTVKSLRLRHFTEIEIPIPPLEEQKQIVAKLDQCFEAIDKAKANAAKNLENAKELFQSKLNEIFSQKGEGWVEKKLGEISDVTYGFTDKSVEVGDFRYVRITDIDNNGELISTGKKYISSSKDGKKFILKDNDILMARTGATFAKLLLYKDIEPSIFASYLIKIDFTESIDNEFYWFYAKSNSYWDQANTLSTGSAQPHFNGKALKQVLFPYPVSKTEQSRLINEFKRFQSKTQSLESKYQQELNSLEELKKSILQKAFEGEL